MSASAPGISSSRVIPASLAALLNTPPRSLAPHVPQFFGTTSVGSMLSGQIKPSTAPAAAATTVATTMAAPSVTSSGLSTLAIQPPASVDVNLPLETASSAPPLRDVVTATVTPFHFDNLITIQLRRTTTSSGVISTIHGPAINPEHRVWEQQDQAILSAIQGSLSEGVAGLCLFAATSLDTWTTLEQAFSQVSTSRSMAIRSKLEEIKKLDSSATDIGIPNGPAEDSTRGLLKAHYPKNKKIRESKIY
ncbi:hypothetical protein QYE76_012770 [Lolium multiflorum]|uniref:Uncharacterized protein n=1 Tax=Lolium multiflorum TaxID=4521 RepID=A0AAD8U1P1_LOLMU|nr:hypothetical protein QYE76_012770 [Lolium multiflorum]